MGAVWVSHDRTPEPCKEWRSESRRSRGTAWESRRAVIPPDGSGIGMQQTSNTSFTAAGIPGAGFLPGERLGINLGRDPKSLPEVSRENAGDSDNNLSRTGRLRC